jgi:SAM-dependent methyltransferase
MRLRVFSVVLAVTLLAGCSSAQDQSKPATPPSASASSVSTAPATPAAQPAAESSAAPAAKTGADPKLNQRFLDPELDISSWVKRFEGESREVYAHRKDIVAALALKPGMRVADIGAGTGLFEGLFDSAVGAQGKVYAVDISPRFLDHLRRRKKGDGWKRVEVVEGSADSPNLPEASVDLVFICDTYHHFTDVQTILANIKRSLRPGGRLVVVDFHRIPGKSSKWLLEHVRADMETFKSEIVSAGFDYQRQLPVPGLQENYALEFAVP